MQRSKFTGKITESAVVASVDQQIRQMLERVATPVMAVHREVPFRDVTSLTGSAEWRADLEIEIALRGLHWKLIVEATSSGEPRVVREKSWWLQHALKSLPAPSYGIVAAPFLSDASREILRESGFGWVDMAGNCRLVFDSVHIEIEKTTKNPFATKRSLHSLFAPKSARLLRLLLTNSKGWKVPELAERTGVSFGQISKVRQALLEKEWAVAEVGSGLRIHRPGPLLDAWREVTHRPEVVLRGYTLLHGRELNTQLHKLFERAQAEHVNVLLASYSVARCLAPFARIAGEFFYADSIGAEHIKQQLRVEVVTKGENIVIYGPPDEQMFDEGIALPNGLRGAGFVQTYLDLWSLGDRGREAADHFRREAMASILKVDK